LKLLQQQQTTGPSPEAVATTKNYWDLSRSYCSNKKTTETSLEAFATTKKTTGTSPEAEATTTY